LESTQQATSKPQGPRLLNLPPKVLVTPRRLDLAVKWRFFRSLDAGANPYERATAERLYRWHIEARSGERLGAGLPTDKWKTGIDDYVREAVRIHTSMAENGFDQRFPVPVDPNGELLDGSHRVACALALGITRITVLIASHYAWALPWDWPWFLQHMDDGDDLAGIRADFEVMVK
jgi:hypothetical protein